MGSEMCIRDSVWPKAAVGKNYPKLMELQSAVDAEEANQDSLLERMLETETELAEFEED